MVSFVQENTVRGMKRSKGEFEGNPYDSTKFYIETSLDESKGNGKGMATAEYTLGKSDEYAKYESLPFPFKAACEYEIVTNGKGTAQMRLVGVKPLKVMPEGGAGKS